MTTIVGAGPALDQCTYVVTTWDPNFQYTWKYAKNFTVTPNCSWDIFAVFYNGDLYKMNNEATPQIGVPPDEDTEAWEKVSGTSGGGVTSMVDFTGNGFKIAWEQATTTPKPIIECTVEGNQLLMGAAGAMVPASPGVDYSAGTKTLPTGLLKSTTGTGGLSIAQQGSNEDYVSSKTLPFTAELVGWSIVGTPVITSFYVQTSDTIYIKITIDPAGGTIACTAGAATITGLPYSPASAQGISATDVTDIETVIKNFRTQPGTTVLDCPTILVTSNVIVINGTYSLL